MSGSKRSVGGVHSKGQGTSDTMIHIECAALHKSFYNFFFFKGAQLYYSLAVRRGKRKTKEVRRGGERNFATNDEGDVPKEIRRHEGGGRNYAKCVLLCRGAEEPLSQSGNQFALKHFNFDHLNAPQ